MININIFLLIWVEVEIVTDIGLKLKQSIHFYSLQNNFNFSDK